MKTDAGTSRTFTGFLRHREEQRERAKQEAGRRQNLLQEIIPFLRKYGIKRAFVFGSVTKGFCRKDSDIDIYVEGLQPDKYWDLWRELEEHTGMSIDLYCERDDSGFVQKIRERGSLIYEA